jgi:hypothetical protein
LFTMMTVIRKKPDVSTDDFRHFMEHEYGPTYSGFSETRMYVQHYLSDVMDDGAEPSIDAIVEISFDSYEDMQTILQTEAYERGHKMRANYMQEDSVGIHSAVVDKTVKFV